MSPTRAPRQPARTPPREHVRCDVDPVDPALNTTHRQPPAVHRTPAASPHETAITGLVDHVLAKAIEYPSTSDRRAVFLKILSELHLPAREREIWRDGVDVLGSAYERLLTGTERRDAGQFQTPFFAADLMAAWLLQEPTRLLLDPGVGAGRLLFRAGIRTNAPERLLGFDNDPLACKMAQINLDLRGLATRSELRQLDFLLDEFPEHPDALICNAPYSRHHSIPAATKTAIHDGLQRRLGLRLSRLASLHALFLIRSLEILANNGRIAFITPADWLDVGYGQRVKQHALKHAHIEAIILFPDGHLPFGADVMSSAAITLLRKHSTPTSTEKADTATTPKPTRIIKLPNQPPLVEDILSALNGQAPTHSLPVLETHLTADSKWGRTPPSRRSPKKRDGRPLGEFARVRRGIATGANRYFVISEQNRKQLGLRTRDLRACITTPRLIPGLELTADTLAKLPPSTPRWALDCRHPDAETKNTPLGRYLRNGRAQGIPDGYLASRRRPWYALERRDACPILFTYFNRAAPRFIRNRTNALPLNTFLIIEPNDGVNADKLWIALNSTAIHPQLQAKRRDYAGMWKLEPRELASIIITM
jgi:adenine-specific DNA-methyltransferase